MAKVQQVQLSSLNLPAMRAEVVAASSELKLGSDGTWLPSTNPYLQGGSKKVAADAQANTANYHEVAAYIAASAFVHSADAWSYLGRAADALLRGDVHASVHLAYYAELRAAKGLLAAEGVYVGNRYSCALDANATLTKVSASVTHFAAWELIDIWFREARSQAAVASIVAPGGHSLDAWVSAIPGGVSAVMQDLLSGLAFDLKSFAEDRERRNLASYEPTSLKPSTLDVETIRRTLSGLWFDLEPMIGGDFPGIDRSILANVLARQYSAQNSVPDPNDPSAIVVDWTGGVGWVDSLMPTALSPSAFGGLLRSDPTGGAFQAMLGFGFTDTSSLSNPADFIRAMISRATVLARLATGLCLRVLGDAGMGVGDLATWATAFAVSRGCLEAAPLPARATDLVTDLDLPREVLEVSRTVSLRALHRDLSDGVGLLGQVDRVVAWSFA